jgi:hypothetical protein
VANFRHSLLLCVEYKQVTRDKGVMDKETSSNSKSRLPRREFLANLLFCGGALSVAALQSEFGILAQTDPKDEGWELPEDDKKKPDADDWDLPDDLLNSPEPPPQKPPEKPPVIMGRKRPPALRGEVKQPPPLLGDVAPPKQE